MGVRSDVGLLSGYAGVHVSILCGMLMAAMRWLALSCAVVSAGMRWLCRASVLPVCALCGVLCVVKRTCPHRCVRCCSVANRGGSLLLAGCHASESICVEV